MTELRVSKIQSNENWLDETARNEWVTACWADMKRRQSCGQKFAAEDYLSPPHSDSNLVVDLVYGEYGLRKAVGEAIDSKEFVRRFPLQTLELQRQFAMDDCLTGDGQSSLPFDNNQDNDELTTIAVPRTPERIGRYLIIETLASGGQAVVYRGLHPDLRMEVAVKVPRCQSVHGDASSDELIAEGRILADLRHPNLARVLDLGQCDEGSYLVSEYIPGRTLEQFVTDQSVSPREAAAMIAKIARGLAVAHRHGVVHLDIKPRNIMIDDRGEPRLIDFGLSVRRNIRIDSLAQWSGIRGTVQFMPPEQALSNNSVVGPRSDIYALGGVLYFLLTRNVPYGTGTWTEILRKARLGAWSRDELSKPGVPHTLRTVCERALCFEPELRFENADQMADALERFVRQVAPSRRRFLIAGGLVAVGALIAWKSVSSPKRGEASAAIMSADASVASSLLEIDVWNDGRFLKLADVAPLKSGDRLRISATVPSSHFASLFVFTSEGQWKLLTQIMPDTGVSRRDVKQFRFPQEENTAIPLSGAAGTEVVVLCSRPEKPILLPDLMGDNEGSQPWPKLPDLTVLQADLQGVSVVQQGRDFGQPVATPDSEWEVRSRLESLRARCEHMPGFTALAFFRE